MAAASQEISSASGSPRYQPLVAVLVAFSAGIVADRYGWAGLGWWLAFSFGGLVLWRLSLQKLWQPVTTFLLLIAITGTGAAWHHMCWHLFRDDDLGLTAGHSRHPICFEAVALSSPRLRPEPPEDPMRTMDVGERSLLRVEVTRVRDGLDWRAASGRTTAIIEGKLRGVTAGDRVQIVGLMSTPQKPLNPGEFDFATHLPRQRELCRVNCDAPECVSIIGPRRGWHPLATVQAMRDRGDTLLWRHLRHERAGLAAAVLLGMREQVDPEQTEHFMTTGTVHLLAISGLHVGILAAGFWFLARFGWLSRRATLVTAIVLVVFYALLTDARPPVVRAAVLISVICIARLLGRRAFEFNTLALAALILLVLNPTNLFQTGTQLSFLAVTTLACAQPLFTVFGQPEDPLQRLIWQSRSWPERVARRCVSFFARLCLTSSVIWLIALPLVMHRFHLVSPIAVLLNPFVWVPMTLALFSGFGVLFFGWWLPPAADVCGWLCDQNLFLIENCIDIARTLPGNHAWIPSPPTWWVAAFYGCLAVAVVFPRLRPRRGWAIAACAGWFAVGFAVTVGPLARAATYKDERLTCTFVSVGHGTSVVVELPDGKTLLYDAGRLGSSQSGVRPIASALWSRGVTHLDAVVLSHADADHYNSLPGLLDRFSVGVVYVSPVMFDEETAALSALHDAIVASGVPIQEIDSTDNLSSTGVTIDVLHPPERGVAGEDNANSIVLHLVYQGRSFLLPGDLEEEGLDDVMAELPLDCDIVMAPHHGSPRSHPTRFAAWSTPEVVVISGGEGRETDAARSAYKIGDTKVLHTARDGAIRIVIDESRVDVSRWQKQWLPVEIPRGR